ncbi:MAG: hypothetical protein V7641_54 [Blastocatellia bacterium]
MTFLAVSSGLREFPLNLMAHSKRLKFDAINSANR